MLPALATGCGGSALPGAGKAQTASSPVNTPVPPANAHEKLSGLCFSPFTKDTPSSGASITPPFVSGLLDIIVPYAGAIRTFGSGGIGASTAVMAKAKGLGVAAGCDIESDPAQNEKDVNDLLSLARSGDVDLAVVGEETQYFHYVSEAQLIDYMLRVKATGTPVTTSETWGELINHPSILAQCDVVMANMFPYWENVNIKDSVRYLNTCYQKVKEASKGKEVLVETGWPTEGETKGAAVANPANARWFLVNFTAWARQHHVRYYYFEAFDEPWKVTHEGVVGGHWGLWDQYGQLKPVMQGAL